MPVENLTSITNPSATDPIVILKYFGSFNPDLEM